MKQPIVVGFTGLGSGIYLFNKKRCPEYYADNWKHYGEFWRFEGDKIVFFDQNGSREAVYEFINSKQDRGTRYWNDEVTEVYEDIYRYHE